RELDVEAFPVRHRAAAENIFLPIVDRVGRDVKLVDLHSSLVVKREVLISSERSGRQKRDGHEGDRALDGPSECCFEVQHENLIGQICSPIGISFLMIQPEAALSRTPQSTEATRFAPTQTLRPAPKRTPCPSLRSPGAASRREGEPPSNRA